MRKPVSAPGRSQPGQPKRRRRPQQNAKSTRRRRLIAAAKVIGIAVAFAALLYGLHLLGFGPQ